MNDIEKGGTASRFGAVAFPELTVGQTRDPAGRSRYRRGSGRILATGADQSVRDRLVPNRFRSIGRYDDQSRLLGLTFLLDPLA